MSKYNRYDIATKLSLVEDCLQLLKDNPKLMSEIETLVRTEYNINLKKNDKKA